ncbi:DUF3817 domain-containing protein [Rhodococcus pyridinivorans]|uniref:DUF3817 domain-containing protein n=8 Tax=Rhodococcus TaxID=1827 RepID=A0A385LDV4_RHORH|nr:MULTISPECIES: DUF3817 domain-containing protein [Rhodococcus]AHD19226.1 membrane protein [Rhodococcus pyridinivorans SB3094]AOD22609.1 hypothetical protein IM25_14155 [Rhodococcus sp. p52]AWZ24608.1 hypothetical protein CEJ39_10790 [Rhodococcus pyridinivorans]AYA25911.1 DUF3817 domain-containing protein [Rhodococcus rhodochrous]EHK80471.1 integral membrane protein [Rhodococcus pyridinivorans AK37]
MSTTPEQASGQATTPRVVSEADRKKIRSALLRYRVLAYATGIWLLILTGEMVAKYIIGVENVPAWIAIVHGWVYAVYLVLTFDLSIKVRWPIARTVWTLLAGTIPFLSFFVEHKRTQQVKADFGV